MPIGQYRHLVTVENHAAPVADGDGGYIETWANAIPATWHCAIVPATARDLERMTAGTAVTEATHILRGHYRAGITTETRLQFGARTLLVKGVANVDERSRELVVLAVEMTP